MSSEPAALAAPGALDRHRLLIVDERTLPAEMRARLADRLCTILDEGPRYLGRAWRTLPPTFRVVGLTADGDPVGHVACTAVAADPPVGLFGIGDVIVDPRHRGHGLARAMCAAAAEACWARGAQAILLKTRPLRGLFGDLGFAPVSAFDFYWEDEDGCHRHPDWMAATRGPVPRPLWLAHGDF